VVLVQQEQPDNLLDGLQPALDAVKDGLSIVFAGPPSLLTRAHQAGKLTTVLDIRKHVLLRWLTVLSSINPEFECPALMQDLASDRFDDALNALPTQIIDSAVHADAELMRKLDEMCDDVAAVRAVLPEEVPAAAAEDDVSAFERVALVPRFSNPSVEEVARTEQRAINSAIIRFETASALENEFDDQRDMLSRAFPWIFCLGGKNAVPSSTGPLNESACRHLLLQHTCAAAHDHDLVFLLQDQKRRHAACRGASAAVASGHLELFQQLMDDARFKQHLVGARAGVEEDAKEIGRLCRPHLSIAGAQIPNGPVERAKAVARIYSMCYELGLPSIYLTVSPDTSHTPAAVRLSIPEGSTEFDVDAFADAFVQGSVFEQPGWTSINLSSPSLQKLCSHNPVAAAETFHNRMNAVLEELLKCPAAHADKKTPARWRLCGVFGTPYGFYAVIEAQGRGALHYHLLFWGSYAPHVLSQAANMPEFKTRLEQALKTQTVAELPREMHVDRLRARGLRAKGLANNAAPLPRMARVPLDAQALDASSILLRAQQCASAQCVHTHTSTCHKGKAGECWCRMCKPEGYQETDCAAFLNVTVTDGVGVSASCVVPDPDVSCTCDRNLDLHPIEAIDHRLIVVELPRRRLDAPLQAHEIADLPDDTARWMKVAPISVISSMLPVADGSYRRFCHCKMASSRPSTFRFWRASPRTRHVCNSVALALPKGPAFTAGTHMSPVTVPNPFSQLLTASTFQRTPTSSRLPLACLLPLKTIVKSTRVARPMQKPRRCARHGTC